MQSRLQHHPSLPRLLTPPSWHSPPDNDVSGEVLLDLDSDALTELEIGEDIKAQLLEKIAALKTHTSVRPCMRRRLPASQQALSPQPVAT